MAELPEVALVDDDEAVRDSTARLLSRVGYRCRTYSSGDEFLKAPSLTNIGCVLLDIRMPGTDGLAVMAALRARGDQLSVIVLTGHGDIALAVEAMKLGACDFLEKPYHPEALIEAIEKGCAKAETDDERRRTKQAAANKVARLTDRQRDVLLGVLRGQQNKIIAYEMGLSIRTVEAYRAQLLDRLGVRGTAEAVKIAIAAGLTQD